LHRWHCFLLTRWRRLLRLSKPHRGRALVNVVKGKNSEKGNSAASAAGRLRTSSLRQTLVDKTINWLRVHGAAGWRNQPAATEADIGRRLDGPGVVVLAHRDRRCFRLVARAANVFSWCSDALRDAFEGSNPNPLSALLVTSVSQNWDFYFISVLSSGKCHNIRSNLR